MMFVRDIETRSTVDLKKVGLHNYATHSTTEILCVGYCIGAAPVKIWHPGDPVPSEYINTVKHGWTGVAHNAPFEMAIERYILGPRYGFPVIPIDRNVCTMACANAAALPASLDKLAHALNLKHRKDVAGNRVMLQMAKPRKPRKDEDPNSVYWFDDAERMLRLDGYCTDDVETCREAAYKLPWLSDDEYQVWLLDQKINNRGIYIDQDLALAARKIIDAAEPYIDAEIAKVTNGQVTSITQVSKLKYWLGPFVEELESLDKKSIDELLRRDLPEHVLRVLELRYLGAQAATKKVDALLSHRNSTGRVYDAFVYHAAGPGRWSSRGVQLHNMKRSITEDIEKAVEIIGQGDFNLARRAYDNPLAVIGDLIRAMIVAAPGHVLIGADFSGIEARITAWLASEQRKLDLFRAFDAGTGPDPYIVAAANIFALDPVRLAAGFKAGKPADRERRQVGKAAELAFGFQGGLGAYLKFDPDTTFSDEEIHRFKNAWRKAHPNIVSMWRDLNRAMWLATRQPSKRVLYRDKLAFEHDGKTLWITLPSGRRLSYPECRIRRILDPNETGGLVIVSIKGKPALIFKDNASGMWHDVVVYGGLITENVVQATARDLLAHAMLRIDAAKLPIVAHVHDEAVCEVPASKAEKILPVFQQLMVKSPGWADGLPVVAKAWSSARYVK